MRIQERACYDEDVSKRLEQYERFYNSNDDLVDEKTYRAGVAHLAIQQPKNRTYLSDTKIGDLYLV